MSTITKNNVFTYQDLMCLPEGNYEIINGERVDMGPTEFRHGEFELIFANLLKTRLTNQGYVSVGEIGIVISKSPFRLRAADVVYVARETSPEKPEGILEFAPDLVIEILSKSDTAPEMNKKVKDYLSIGVKRIIIVDPYTEMITTYPHDSKDAKYCGFDDEFELFNGVNITLRDIL